MLNVIWITLVFASVVCGALACRLAEVAQASVEAANAAAHLALGMVGIMALWLGLMRVLHEAGLMQALARGLRPVLARLFPMVPSDHPALAMMVLNMTSNMLGLGNAATPFGLRAMRALNELNPHPGVASDAMVRFLAINTSGLAVLPTGMIALRASMGASAPASIFFPTLISTFGAAIAGLVASNVLAPLFAVPQQSAPANSLPLRPEPDQAAEQPQPSTPHRMVERSRPRLALALLGLVVFSLGVSLWQQTHGPDAQSLGTALHQAVGTWPLVLLLLGFVLVGIARGVNVYDAVVAGGKEGFDVAVRIIPYLVAILVAVGMLRASGAVAMVVSALAPLTEAIGLPAEALPMVLVRPLSGTGAYAIVADTLRTTGPDSLASEIVCTIMGTTETTFYVLAVYLGAVGIRVGRHAVWACLVADGVGVVLATWTCRLLLH